MIGRFGFCSSYTEACKYRKNAATTQGVDLVNEIGDSFAHYQADNVDHAGKTLDGNGAIHVMGQMATFTPAVKTKRVVPRMEINMNDLKNIGHVKLITQRNPKDIVRESLAQMERFLKQLLQTRTLVVNEIRHDVNVPMMI